MDVCEVPKPADDRIPVNWVGSAVLESVDSQPFAAIVNQVNGAGPSMSYVGIERPGSRVSAPLLFKRAAGWNTGLQVQNTGARTATITALLKANGDDASIWTETAVVGPGASATFYQPANPELPDSFVGSASVSTDAGQVLVGVVNEVRSDSTMATAYEAVDQGATTLYVPLVYRGYAGWNSGTQVQNLGASATTTTMTFYRQNGSVAASVQRTIEPGDSEPYYLPSISGLSDGFIGSAVGTSSGEPLAAIVNQVKPQ